MNGLRKISILFLGIVAGVGIFSFVILGQTKKLKNKYEIRVNNQIIIADVAKTDSDREKGLSGRDGLGINEGMLFEFSDPQMVTFWMKDMKFPIDIVWISGGIVLGYVERVDPQIGATEDELIKYNSPSSVDEVLEISAGRAKQLKLFVGSTVDARPLVNQ